MIIPVLYERQKQRGGYLTHADMASVADELGVSLHRINALVTFFPHFKTEPPAEVEVHICRDMSCHLNGSESLIRRMEKWAEATHGKKVEVCGVSCLGRCDRPPAAMVNDQLVASGTEGDLRSVVDAIIKGDTPTVNSDWELAKAKVWRLGHGHLSGQASLRDGP